MSEPLTTFDYVDLNEIDPNLSPLDPEMYTLKIVKAEKRDFTYKSGKQAGNPGQLLSFTLVVTNNDQYNGRRIFASLFPSDFTFRMLKRIADATGVQQTPKSPIETWLEELTIQQPEVRVPVKYKTDRDGSIVLTPAGKPADNEVDWRNVQPV